MDILTNAKKDFLTDFYVKENLDHVLNKLKAECKIYKSPFSILVVDLDHFKAYNDKYGHLDGDEVLRYFASTIRLSLSGIDYIAVRFGGDEFIILFPGKNSGETHSLANELMKNLHKRPFLMRGRVFKMNFSGGITAYPEDGTEVGALLHRADKAMYFSKTHGRGKITEYRMIWLDTIKGVGGIILAALLLLGIFFNTKYMSKDYFSDMAKRVKGVQLKVSSSAPIKLQLQEPDTVYLKSGGVFRGEITKEGRDHIEIKFRLDRGEGDTIIKKSDIKRIERKGR